tara:strand:- start:2749 stop:2940 length:192 start_codon:yes stop_codon:yes gene_type:complete
MTKYHQQAKVTKKKMKKSSPPPQPAPQQIHINATAKENKWTTLEKQKAKIKAKLKPRVPKRKK